MYVLKKSHTHRDRWGVGERERERREERGERGETGERREQAAIKEHSDEFFELAALLINVCIEQE
jgi:hypothetical protein